MRASVLVSLVALAALCLVGPRPASASPIRVAEADTAAPMAPLRSPGTVIEQPRPPRAAIETEGRSEHRDCHDLPTAEPNGRRRAPGTAVGTGCASPDCRPTGCDW
jgi:hypothetical protein